jgi:hypothetical protein
MVVASVIIILVCPIYSHVFIPFMAQLDHPWPTRLLQIRLAPGPLYWRPCPDARVFCESTSYTPTCTWGQPKPAPFHVTACTRGPPVPPYASCTACRACSVCSHPRLRMRATYSGHLIQKYTLETWIKHLQHENICCNIQLKTTKTFGIYSYKICVKHMQHSDQNACNIDLKLMWNTLFLNFTLKHL